MKFITSSRIACLVLILFIYGCTTKENLAFEVDGPLVAVPDLVYQAPIVITKGGTYTGNYRSTDAKVPAIFVQTSEPVEITGCTIASAGDLIRCDKATSLNIHHNSLYGLPNTTNDQWGRALNDYQPRSLIFQNNYVEHTGGLLLDHTDSAISSIVIRYNIIRNVDKRRTDLSPGENRYGIIFNSVLKVSGEISWNQFENQMERSYVEHVIDMYNSGGKAGAPYLIHDNYIKGAYPYPLNARFVGSGITVDGDPGANTMQTMSQYIEAYNNQIISTCNAAMNLAAGHDIHYYGNTMISCGRYPNSARSDAFWGGCCLWNASNVPAAYYINNSIKGNKIGYVRPGKSVPFRDRQDWVIVPGNPVSVEARENKSLGNPITLETEWDQWPMWLEKLSVNKITIGNVR